MESTQNYSPKKASARTNRATWFHSTIYARGKNIFLNTRFGDLYMYLQIIHIFCRLEGRLQCREAAKMTAPAGRSRKLFRISRGGQVHDVEARPGPLRASAAAWRGWLQDRGGRPLRWHEREVPTAVPTAREGIFT